MTSSSTASKDCTSWSTEIAWFISPWRESHVFGIFERFFIMARLSSSDTASTRASGCFLDMVSWTKPAILSNIANVWNRVLGSGSFSLSLCSRRLFKSLQDVTTNWHPSVCAKGMTSSCEWRDIVMSRPPGFRTRWSSRKSVDVVALLAHWQKC